MDYHLSELPKHCRVCGGHLQTGKREYKATTYSTEAFSDQLRMAFGVDVSEDSASIHPQSFCKVCKVALGRLLDAKTRGVPYRCSVQVYQWEEHREEECKVKRTIAEIKNEC